MKVIRIRADEAVVGDRIAHARTHDFKTVTRIDVGPKSRWLYLAEGGRIRPNHSTPMWRTIRKDPV